MQHIVLNVNFDPDICSSFAKLPFLSEMKKNGRSLIQIWGILTSGFFVVSVGINRT